jgi:4-methyl-5(b-hydroxyethyl)-thiazole monophosphate biosynthesis
MASQRVLVPLAQGCEELEAVTIIDLLRRAGIEVITAGLDTQPVRGSRGTVLIPDTSLDEVMTQAFDMVVLPGGLPGADHLEADVRIQQLLINMYESDRYIAAICAAPKVLASAGLLQGKQVTCFPGVLDGADIEGMIVKTDPVVQDGKVITSRGPGTAMDFSLLLIESLVGRDKRDEVEISLQRF